MIWETQPTTESPVPEPGTLRLCLTVDDVTEIRAQLCRLVGTPSCEHWELPQAGRDRATARAARALAGFLDALAAAEEAAGDDPDPQPF